jgi:hypothetical protein
MFDINYVLIKLSVSWRMNDCREGGRLKRMKWLGQRQSVLPKPLEGI